MHECVTGRKKETKGKVALGARKCGDGPSGLQDRPFVVFLSLEVPDLSLEEVSDLSLEVPEDLEDESSFVERDSLFLEAWPSCVFPR